MSDFVTQLRLAEKAAEDIYFAKLSRALIVSLHKQVQAERDSIQASDPSSVAALPEVSPETMGTTQGRHHKNTCN